MDPLLEGQGPDERVVAAAQVNDRTIRLYLRADGKTTHRDAEFFPFFFLTDPELLEGFEEHHWQKELAGTNPLRYIIAFERWSDMWSAVHHVLRRHNQTFVRKAATYHEVESLFVRPDPVRQYLLQSGVSMFRGMAIPDLRRIQVDLLLRPRTDRRPAEPSILAIAASGGADAELLLSSNDASESEMLEEFIRWVRVQDPDVIEGHLLVDRILPALLARCEGSGIPALLGRDDRPMQLRPGRTWHGAGEFERLDFDIPGRHCLDTARVAADRFPSSHWISVPPLAAVGRLLFDPPEAPAVQTMEELAQRWEREPAPVGEEMRARVRLLRRVAERLLAPVLQQSRWCPLPLGVLSATGVPARLESLLLREYVRAKHSLPRARSGAASVGGFAEAFRTGLFRDVLHLHLDNLHASLIAAEDVVPEPDQLRVFPRLAAALIGASVSDGHPEEDGARTLASGLSAYLASPFSLFHDANAAVRLERAATETVAAAVRRLVLHNASVLHAGTHEAFVVPPDNVVGPANVAAFVQRLNAGEQPSVRFMIGWRLPAMLCHRRRSYAILDERDNVHVTGTTLLPRSGERFIRRFLLRSVECLLTSDTARLHHTYASYHTMVTQHRWQVTDFCRYETVREELEDYLRDLEAGTRTPSPAIEAARRSAVYPRAGSRIAYYVGGSHPDVRLADVCRVAEDWDANFPSENTAYYLQKLDDAAARLRDFFEPRHFETIFALDDLFGFNGEGISIVERILQPGGPGSDSEGAEAEGPGIWLADPE